ncbi:MAG: response regulator [Methylocella sp.]
MGKDTALGRSIAATVTQEPRILLVEDDLLMRHMVADYLEEHQMRVASASGRRDMTRYFAGGEPNLVILDLRLGQENGLELLHEIRSRSEVPVIIVTGYRSDEVDRVVGLELGADDYLTKPFGLRELLARIRAVLRRGGAGTAAPQQAQERGRCQFCGWRLDLRTRQLVDPNEVLVSLTKAEYSLLVAFVEAPQRPLSREHLLEATRVHNDVFNRNIDVQVLRLRRKLEVDPGVPQFIQTQRGVGYMFSAVVEWL